MKYVDLASIKRVSEYKRATCISSKLTNYNYFSFGDGKYKDSENY